MSGLIDMWTNEGSKLKEKEKGHGSSTHMEAESRQQQQQKEKISSIGFAVAAGKFNPLNKHTFLCSEDCVSLLVTCFSP